MSDMEQTDVDDVEPVAEPVAPAPEVSTETQDSAAVQEPEAEQVSPDPVPVVAQQPSSASPTQQPEDAPVAEEEPISLADAARALIVFVKAHRTAGDSDLEAAVADVEAAIVAQDA